MNKIGFQKGHPFYKGGEKGWFKKGIRSSPSTEFKKGQIPLNWKGNKAKYAAKHMWIYAHYGKATKCENLDCHFPRKNSKGVILNIPNYYHWANKNHKYKRIRKDWIQLCPSCHKKFDKKIIKL